MMVLSRFVLLASMMLFSAVLAPRPAGATAFTNGEFLVYSGDDWGTSLSDAALLMDAHFDAIYGEDGLNVGIIGLSGFSMTLTSATATRNYLPDVGTPGPLTADVADPQFTTSGIFGSHLVALTLNVDLSDAGYLPRSLGVTFGDLVIGADNSGQPALGANQTLASQFYGLSVRQFLADANQALGGGASYNAGYVQTAALLNTGFGEGFVSETAQRQLSFPTASSAVPEPKAWALLLVGLFMIGGILRHHQTVGSNT